jgi:hypothetical protein
VLSAYRSHSLPIAASRANVWEENVGERPP